MPLFRRYWLGHTAATVGRWMKRTAVGWLAWELTESPAWLGLVTFCDLLPTVLLAILAGAISDRFGFMRIIRFSQLSSAALAIVFAALVISETINIYGVAFLTFLFGAFESMGQPARMSAVHALVDRGNLSSAIALGSASFNASRIVGPGIAGFLIVWSGSGVVIGLSSLTFLTFYLILRTLDFGDTASSDKQSIRTLFTDIWSGIAYAFDHPGMRFVFILLAATSFFIRPVIELMPGISGRVFDAGPTGLSLLLGAIGAGALTASLWLARRGELRGLTSILITTTVITGMALALAMQFGNIWIAAFFLAIMGAAMLTGNVSAQTLVQNTVAAEMRARVMSIFIVFAYGLPAIGAVVMGWLASYAGLQTTVGAGAVFMLLFWAWSRPQRTVMTEQLERESEESGTRQ